MSIGIKPFPNPGTGAYYLSDADNDAALVASRAGTESQNPPSTNLPADVRLMSDAPPPIPSTGPVKHFNPVETPRAAALARTVNDAQPHLSVNLREDFINQAVGGSPLSPTIIANGAGQELVSAEPGGAEDGPITGPNAVGSGPILTTEQPTITGAVVGPPSPESNFI